MFEKIMNLVKGQAMDTIGGMQGVPEEKKKEVVETTAGSLIDGLKEHAASGGIASLLGMGGAGAGSGSLSSGLVSNVVDALTSKVGLNPSVAQKIASSVVPAVTSLLKGKVADTGEPGFNLESLVGGLTGKGSGGAAGGIMNAVEGLFGKKS